MKNLHTIIAIAITALTIAEIIVFVVYNVTPEIDPANDAPGCYKWNATVAHYGQKCYYADSLYLCSSPCYCVTWLLTRECLPAPPSA